MNQVSFFKYALLSVCFASLIFSTSCEEDDPIEEEVPETITTTVLTFTPDGGGSPLTFEANDPDGDGPEPKTLDDIVLDANTTYMLSIQLLNELLSSTDEGYNITAEVEEEGTEHMFFFGWKEGIFSNPTGDGNIGEGQRINPVNYNDDDDNDYPIGLETTWTTGAAATGTFNVILKHQPDIKSDTSDSTDGESDVDHVFNISIK